MNGSVRSTTCTHARTHTRTNTHARTRTHARTHAHTHTHEARMHAYTHTHARTHTRVRAHTRTHAHMCTYTRAHTPTRAHPHTRTYTHTRAQGRTGRQRPRVCTKRRSVSTESWRTHNKPNRTLSQRSGTRARSSHAARNPPGSSAAPSVLYSEYSPRAGGKLAALGTVCLDRYRAAEWLASHLRTFKLHLWRKVRRESLCDPEGRILDMTGAPERPRREQLPAEHLATVYNGGGFARSGAPVRSFAKL
jgi:hypothetical protein